MLPENRRAEYVSRRQVGGVVLAEAEAQDRSEGRSQRTHEHECSRHHYPLVYGSGLELMPGHASRDSNGCIAVEAPLHHDSGEV
jgi:hypothetical protein